MLIELLRNKHKLPFDYYKEIIGNYRNQVYDMDIPQTLFVVISLQHRSRFILQLADYQNDKNKLVPVSMAGTSFYKNSYQFRRTN